MFNLRWSDVQIINWLSNTSDHILLLQKNSIAYHLALLPSSTIDPIFHVPLLKKAVGPHIQVSSNLSLSTDNL